MGELSGRNAPSLADIKLAQDLIGAMPQIQLEVKHHFSDGVYAREVHVPAGCKLVGKIHNTRHLNILLSGTMTIWSVHGKMTITGPKIFESLAGEKKVGLAHTDCRFLNIHPTEEKDVRKIEGEVIRPEEQTSLFPELEREKLIRSEQLCLGAS
jgi:hypothetical protein